MKSQPVSLENLRRTLSAERLQAYAAKGDTDEVDAVGRYIWNLALGSALQPALHVLEIALRNHLFEHSRKIIDEGKLEFSSVPCWLDAVPTLLDPKAREAVEVAKAYLVRLRRPLTPGRLIGRLSFGFWVSLCKRPYEQGAGGPGLWPKMATSGFPFMKQEYRTRSTIFHRLDDIRDLRNRVSHHDPIWDRDLTALHSEVLETLSWMNLGLANVLRGVSPFPEVVEVVEAGVNGYRATAEKIVKRKTDEKNGEED